MEAMPSAAAPAPLEPWVWPFLQTEYYQPCATHEHINNKNTLFNHFCIDCVGPICEYCTSSKPHAGHRNLQVITWSTLQQFDACFRRGVSPSLAHPRLAASTRRASQTSSTCLACTSSRSTASAYTFSSPAALWAPRRSPPPWRTPAATPVGGPSPAASPRAASSAPSFASTAQGSRFCSILCKYRPGQQLAYKSSNNTPLSGGNSSAQLCAVALDKYRKRPAAEGGRGGHGRKRARSEVRSDRSTCPRPETARAAPVQKNLKEKKGQQQEEYSKIIGLAAAAAATAVAGLDASSHVCIRVHRR